MRRALKSGVTITLSALAVLFVPDAAPQQGGGAEAAESNEALPTEIRAASEQFGRGDFRGASRTLRRLVSAEGDDELSPVARHFATSLLTQAEMRLGNQAAAHRASVRASEGEYARPANWLQRAYLARFLGDLDDFATSLTVVARRWPEYLTSRDPGEMFGIMDTFDESAPASDAYFEVLHALYQQDWHPQSLRGASRFLRALALGLLERERLQEAVEVTRRIDYPPALIGMKVDRRFDALGRADPESLDIDDAIAREIALLRASVEESPDSLRAIIDLSEALRHARRNEEAVQLLEGAMARIEAATEPLAEFDDARIRLPWLYDEYADLLVDLGRPDEAVAQLETARALPQENNRNIDQTINLALLHARLGDANRAQALVNWLRRKVRPSYLGVYGQLQMELVLVIVGVQEDRQSRVTRSLERIREWAHVSPATYQSALLYAGRLDEAAEYLISRLGDPQLRMHALLAVQDYAEPASGLRTPLVEAYREAEREMLSRPDVQSQIAAVGRVAELGVRRIERIGSVRAPASRPSGG